MKWYEWIVAAVVFVIIILMITAIAPYGID